MKIRTARKLAHLSQKQLGDLAGIHDSSISLLESGLRDIGGMGYYTVVRLRRALAPDRVTEDVFPVPDIATTKAQRSA